MRSVLALFLMTTTENNRIKYNKNKTAASILYSIRGSKLGQSSVRAVGVPLLCRVITFYIRNSEVIEALDMKYIIRKYRSLVKYSHIVVFLS